MNSRHTTVRFAVFLLCGLVCQGGTSLQAQDSGQNASPNDFYAAVKWRCIGPFRGGRSVCASGVIGKPQTYFMGTTGGGVWKTLDGGHHWKNVSDGFFGTGSVGAIAVSESEPNVVYVGMGEHAPRGVMTSHGDGVYKSTDGGKTWQHLGLAETEHISRICIHPTDPNIVYVAAQGSLYRPSQQRGVYRSIDGGKSWDRVHFVGELSGCAELSIDVSNPQVLYAAMWHHQRKPWKIISGGSGSGIYKSSDGGDTWSEIHDGLPEEKGKSAITVSRSNPNKVYLLLESDSSEEKGGLFVSSNGGEKWSRVSQDHRLIQRAWYYTEVFVDPSDEHTVYVLSASALRSIDGGKSWETLSGTHGDHHDLWINPTDSNNMVIANDGGAAISFDQGAHWSRQSNMPTAQFYRVASDNQFPYRIYGGQQDNSSISIASLELGSGGITESSWSPSAGGESAFLAFDPYDPRYVMGGSYLGTIELYDSKTATGTNIMAAPIQYLGKAAREMRYLYNWNAPVIRSVHENDTFYHAAQFLLRTRDRGLTWEEASPDLTRNQDNRQGKGGGPLTVEAVGAENYGTISYVAESPHQAGVIWTGSDDGMVHLTRDGTKTWTDVTPQDLDECLINAIEISPHDPEKAYIATTRYKFGDKRPGLYKTEDFGATWTEISTGIPDGAFTRVVREDTEREGLLFAGTETGVYVSHNDGEDWDLFQLNLPITPIQDLLICHDDIVVATSGRSFWILDDLELIRQQMPTDGSAHLFEPAGAFLSSHSSELNSTDEDFDGAHPLRGVNPASGVVIYYHLPKLDDEQHIRLEILDSQSEIVNTFTSEKDETHIKYAGGPPSLAKLPKRSGLNRFVWNMRHPNMPGIPKAYIEGSYRGHKASPGKYTLQLFVGDELVSTTEAEISPNPLYDISSKEYGDFHAFMSGMEQQLTEMHEMTNRLYKQQEQLRNLLKRIEDDDQHVELVEEGEKLADELREWDELMVQRKSKAYDDVENFPNKFTADYLFLINQTESGLPRLTNSVKARRMELDGQWTTLRKQGQALADERIPEFNRQLWKAKIGAIWEQ
ncbi:MAG TPA: glycosyl hydrolase [Planctomycetaceae bacterium]|nr:glycosyl hydrolase [Planctomycetaceae bacterium]